MVAHSFQSLSWLAPIGIGSMGVFPTPRYCPMNLTFKQLVVILTILLLLAVGIMYEAYSMFPSVF